MSKIALISGATSGIGLACSKRLASESYKLILCGRRNDRLQAIAEELIKNHSIEVKTLCFDIRNNEELISSLDGLEESWKKIDVLVNNAGLAAGKDPIQNGLVDDWDRMIDTNVKGLLYLSRKVIPWMINHKSGDIINIASIAGKEVYPDGNVYCASKHAVDALSRGMRLDLVKHGIRVTNIAPGLVDTEFSEVRFHGDVNKAKAVYKGIEVLSGDDVAECVSFAISRPQHVQIGDMLILPRVQASATLIHKGDLV